MPVLYDDAKKQWEQLFREESGRDPYAEDYQDFENKYRQTADYRAGLGIEGDAPGPGLDRGARDWLDLLRDTQGDLNIRFRSGGDRDNGGYDTSEPDRAPNYRDLSHITGQGSGTTPQGQGQGSGPSVTDTSPDRSSREAYVQQLYQWFLNRTPSPEELRSHIDNYRGSNWTNDVLATFINSQEWRQRAPGEITKLYQQLLGRTPGEQEIAAHLGNPAGLVGVQNVILQSQEYAQRNPAGSGPPPPTGGTPPPTTQGSTGGPFPGFSGNTFSDPATTFAEQAALTRYNQRTNPDPNSGIARYEQFAREFAEQLQGDVFSDQEEAALRTRAFEQLEQVRRRRIAEKEVELSRRGISRDSGLYRHEMNRIRDEFDRMRAGVENELLTMAITERQRRLTQSFSVLASLAASEEGRFDAALSLAMIPLQLQDQAFQRLVMASGLGGDLSGVTNSLVSLLNMATNARLYNEQTRAQALGALGQFIGQYWM